MLLLLPFVYTCLHNIIACHDNIVCHNIMFVNNTANNVVCQWYCLSIMFVNNIVCQWYYVCHNIIVCPLPEAENKTKETKRGHIYISLFVENICNSRGHLQFPRTFTYLCLSRTYIYICVYIYIYIHVYVHWDVHKYL